MAEDREGLMQSIMGAMSDEGGLFQGGEEGRMFGRVRDAFEGKKGTAGHGLAMALSGVSKEGEDSWQRDLDYEDLPERTKRHGGIRGKAREFFGAKQGWDDPEYAQMKGGEYGDWRAHDYAVEGQDTEYRAKKLQHALDSGDIETRNKMMTDWMGEKSKYHWGKEGVPSHMWESDLDDHYRKNPLYKDTEMYIDRPRASGEGTYRSAIGMKDFGFEGNLLSGNPEELGALYESMDKDQRSTLLNYLRTEGEEYGLLGEGQSGRRYQNEMFDKYIKGPQEAGEKGGRYGDIAAGILEKGSPEEDDWNVRDLVGAQQHYGATKRGQEAFQEGFDRRIEDAGY